VCVCAGGFQEFQARHPSLVETKPQLCLSSTCPSSASAKMASLSQPCLSTSSGGPTRILPFLYLGSQQDALSQDTLHVSSTSPLLTLHLTLHLQGQGSFISQFVTVHAVTFSDTCLKGRFEEINLLLILLTLCCVR
jgi:hypothetical protein